QRGPGGSGPGRRRPRQRQRGGGRGGGGGGPIAGHRGHRGLRPRRAGPLRDRRGHPAATDRRGRTAVNEATDAGSGPLLGLGTWTRQGPATPVLREGAWVVLVPGLRKQVTEAAWEVLGRRPAPEEFLTQLVEAG